MPKKCTACKAVVNCFCPKTHSILLVHTLFAQILEISKKGQKLYLAISCVARFIWLKYSKPPWHFEPLRKLCLLYGGNLMYTYFHLFQNNPWADEMQIVDYSAFKVRGRYHFKGHCRCLDRETHICVKPFLVTFYNGLTT